MRLKDYIYNKISKLFKLNSPSEMLKEGEYLRLMIDDNIIFNKLTNESLIHLTLYGNPATKKNSMQIYKNKKTGQSFLSQSARYKEYARDCGRQITGRYKKGIDYPINLKCVYYRKTRHRVDLTNLLAATCDILADYGVIKDDNCKIVVGHDGSKVLYDKNNPRVEIEIKEVNGYEF
ncbi:RusA family crossover junction endodeoxyribonuclease [Anaerococcus rubeinfantis]|uniref:RusA family crossover junction endodeoxyribonuclease n=1 Tax=Anaerococcus rubeinfantis TaxID=1720199 RepID=UPI000AD0C108|nr:RusA family crossover junction endodeoxyribonuclease [Anaerococcus rubeinfantis]